MQLEFYCANSRRFTATIQRPDKNVDRPINKLHGEVRRTGRVTRRDIEKKLVEIRRNVSSTQSLQLIQCCGKLLSNNNSPKDSNDSQNLPKCIC